jgi:hypothetical protein
MAAGKLEWLPWDPYSRAKYLWELAHKELMPLDRIVAFCGGNKREVTTAIQAYADREHYYRPICDADDFDTEKYSGFVELQSTKERIERKNWGQSRLDSALHPGAGWWVLPQEVAGFQDNKRIP